jgi:hypothetical protein
MSVETPPNVVFIMAYDMGWGDVASYNPESLIPTPNIDRLSEEDPSAMNGLHDIGSIEYIIIRSYE